MRQSILRLAALFGLGLCPLTILHAQAPATPLTFTYTYSGYAMPIPVDSADTAVLLKVVFPRAVTISKATASVQVDYPYVGDLNIYLFSPAGTRVKLLERNCESLVNVNTSFDDAAQSKYADFCPAEAGRGPFQGNEPLSNFNGENSLGTWTLAVENNGSDARSGQAVSFSVTITGVSQTKASLAPDGVRNSGSPLVSGKPIAPGEVVSVFGYNLGPQQGITTSEPYWPTWIDGTVVRINGQDAPMRYISFYRVDVEVPVGLDLSKNAKLTVFRNSATSNEIEVPVAATSPAVFTVNLTGTGQAVALNMDGKANNSGNPAAKGSTVVVWVNGLGLTEPLWPEGQTVPTGVDFVPVAPVFATIDGFPAVVKSAKLVPGQVAVFAVAIEIPSGVNSGPREVVVSAGGASSQQGATIQVR